MFVIFVVFQVDSHYIVSHLAPQMSESGTLKHTKEVQILNNFQDFLMELEGKFVFISGVNAGVYYISTLIKHY